MFKLTREFYMDGENVIDKELVLYSHVGSLFHSALSSEKKSERDSLWFFFRGEAAVTQATM